MRTIVAFAVAFVCIGATSDTPHVVEAPGSGKLVFDTSNAPDLRKWTEEKLAPLMSEWVVKLTDIMASDGWEPPKEILFQFVGKPLNNYGVAHFMGMFPSSATARKYLSIRKSMRVLYQIQA